MPRSGRLSLVLALGVLCGACAAGRLERPFAAGEYLEVARLFEADSALQRDEGALYRAGLVYGMPTSPAYSPERAIEVFERLIALHPNSPRRTTVAQILPLLRENERVQGLRVDLETRLDSLRAEVSELAARTDSLLAERERVTVRAEALQTIADRLTRDVQERNARIRALEDELAGLKEIDLNRQPAAAPAEPPRP